MCHPEPTPKKISNLVPIGLSKENYDNLSVCGRIPHTDPIYSGRTGEFCRAHLLEYQAV